MLFAKMKIDKEIIMISTAIVMLASGIALSYLSFYLSIQHIIHDSVLWYFAQTIVYASSVFGIGSYVDVKLNHRQLIKHDKT